MGDDFDSNILHLMGAVGPKMLRAAVEGLEAWRFYGVKNPIVRITSDGGDADIGIAIAGLINTYELPITTEVYGRCYSAATLIFAAGTKRRMQKWAWCMVHEASDSVEGTASRLKHAAKDMERNEQHWNSIMQELTGTEYRVWEKLNEKDTYLNADECLKLNLATEIF